MTVSPKQSWPLSSKLQQYRAAEASHSLAPVSTKQTSGLSANCATQSQQKGES